MFYNFITKIKKKIVLEEETAGGEFRNVQSP
jgi:hypothetical protein